MWSMHSISSWCDSDNIHTFVSCITVTESHTVCLSLCCLSAHSAWLFRLCSLSTCGLVLFHFHLLPVQWSLLWTESLFKTLQFLTAPDRKAWTPNWPCIWKRWFIHFMQCQSSHRLCWLLLHRIQRQNEAWPPKDDCLILIFNRQEKSLICFVLYFFTV